MNILDLKILQVFFKNRGEILVFDKMLNVLIFLVLLYVSGHFKQKKIFQTDRKILKSGDFRLMAESRQKAV